MVAWCKGGRVRGPIMGLVGLIFNLGGLKPGAHFTV
jgi:hypothetical protein